jgi:hypothetical protein
VNIRLLYIRYKKKTLWTFSSKARSAFPFISLLSLTLFFLFALLKIIYGDKQQVGKDIGITMIHAILPPVIITALVIYFFIVIKFLKGLIESIISGTTI